MRRAEPPGRLGWKTSLGFISVVVIALAAVLVGVAIYSYDLDDIYYLEDMGGLDDGVRALISKERRARDAAGPGHRHVMQVQGTWNGLTLSGADQLVQTAAAMGAPVQEVPQGVVVVAIDPKTGARAREAGIVVGDVIVAIDQQPVRGLTDLHALSHTLNAREPIMIDVVRQGQLQTLVMPPEPPPTQIGLPAALAGPSFFCPRDGILIPAARAGSGVCPVCGGPLHRYDPNAQAGIR